jgi:hypothetical protein
VLESRPTFSLAYALRSFLFLWNHQPDIYRLKSRCLCKYRCEVPSTFVLLIEIIVCVAHMPITNSKQFRRYCKYRTRAEAGLHSVHFTKYSLGNNILLALRCKCIILYTHRKCGDDYFCAIYTTLIACLMIIIVK